MITGQIFGDRELVRNLQAFPAVLRAEVDPTVQRLGLALQAAVQTKQLTGQMYKVRTGRLRASIAAGAAGSTSRFESTPTSSTYTVGTNVSYAKPLFLGSAAHDILPVKKRALAFEIGGVKFVRRKVHMPARAGKDPLSTELQEMRPLIVEQLDAALRRAMRQAVGQ